MEKYNAFPLATNKITITRKAFNDINFYKHQLQSTIDINSQNVPSEIWLFNKITNVFDEIYDNLDKIKTFLEENNI